MKRPIALAAAALLYACGVPKTTVTVENPLPIDRADELVEVPIDRLPGAPPYTVSADGREIPSQLTHDGLLIFPGGIGPGGKRTFTIAQGTPAHVETRTTGRFAPERLDDFIWENDRVAFRIYGAALAPVDGPSGGLDALFKRTGEMILDKWYSDALENGLSYHDDNGTGLDDYKVGRTLGAGGAAPYIDGGLVLGGNFVGQELLDAGPLRTTFRLTYPPLAIPGGTTITETRTFSLDAASQLTRVVQQYDGLGAPLTVAVGYPLHADAVNYYAQGRTLMVEEPATAKSRGVWLGAVLPSRVGVPVEDSYEIPPGEKGAGVHRHVLAMQTYTPGTPMIYYTGFGWERFGGWTGDRFAKYLADRDAALQNPFIIRYR